MSVITSPAVLIGTGLGAALSRDPVRGAALGFGLGLLAYFLSRGVLATMQARAEETS